MACYHGGHPWNSYPGLEKGRIRLRLRENASRDTIVPSEQGEFLMKRFVEGEDRNQCTCFPERLDDYMLKTIP